MKRWPKKVKWWNTCKSFWQSRSVPLWSSFPPYSQHQLLVLRFILWFSICLLTPLSLPLTLVRSPLEPEPPGKDETYFVFKQLFWRNQCIQPKNSIPESKATSLFAGGAQVCHLCDCWSRGWVGLDVLVMFWVCQMVGWNLWITQVVLELSCYVMIAVCCLWYSVIFSGRSQSMAVSPLWGGLLTYLDWLIYTFYMWAIWITEVEQQLPPVNIRPLFKRLPRVAISLAVGMAAGWPWIRLLVGGLGAACTEVQRSLIWRRDGGEAQGFIPLDSSCLECRKMAFLGDVMDSLCSAEMMWIMTVASWIACTHSAAGKPLLPRDLEAAKASVYTYGPAL